MALMDLLSGYIGIWDKFPAWCQLTVNNEGPIYNLQFQTHIPTYQLLALTSKWKMFLLFPKIILTRKEINSQLLISYFEYTIASIQLCKISRSLKHVPKLSKIMYKFDKN